MYTARFTYEQASKALDDLISERGADSRYVSVSAITGKKSRADGTVCTYSTQGGQGDCPIGYLLEKLAPEVFEVIHRFEHTPEGGIRAVGTVGMLASGGALIKNNDGDREYLGIEVSYALGTALSALQRTNDIGSPLIDAVRDFHRVYNREQQYTS